MFLGDLAVIIIVADYHVWVGLVFYGLILGHIWLNRQHKPQPFDWTRLGKAMAELGGMLYLGAYVVKKIR